MTNGKLLNDNWVRWIIGGACGLILVLIGTVASNLTNASNKQQIKLDANCELDQRQEVRINMLENNRREAQLERQEINNKIDEMLQRQTKMCTIVERLDKKLDNP